MNHKRNMLIILLGLALIVVLALAWPIAPVQAEPALPPRNPIPSHPPPPEEDDDDDDGPTVGAYIELVEPGAPAWAVVQWQDSAGNWHDVEGWRGSLPGSSRWWVHPKDFKTGPFRWAVLERPGGAIVGASGAFHLPTGANQTRFISMPLE